LTRLTVAKAYDRWLTHLRYSGADLQEPPATRITHERVRGYFRLLSRQLAPVTTAGHITNLAEAVRVMAPDTDTKWLSVLARKLNVVARPIRQKEAETLPLRDLYVLGLSLMKEAQASSPMRLNRAAGRYRQGLMIACLASCPIRRSNFVTLELGSNLFRSGDRFSIKLGAEATKGKRPFEALLPSELTHWIDLYLSSYRPRLLASRKSDRVWISWLGDDLSEAGFYQELRKVTEARLGVAVCPHRFRDSAVTSVALSDPHHFHILLPILQHRSTRTTNRHYNQAQQASAIEKLGKAVVALRQSKKSRDLR
jgi:site-specific recombinase XerD